MKRGFKKWTEKEAVRVREELGLPPRVPLQAEELAEHLKVEILAPEAIPGVKAGDLNQLLVTDRRSWSAASFSLNGVRFLIHNTSHSLRRQQTNVMHELAHFLCDHNPAVIAVGGPLPFALRSYDEAQEEEANWLAATLKLPRIALLSAARQGKSDSQIARQFNCSTDLVRFRRQVTGVDRQLRRSAVQRHR